VKLIKNVILALTVFGVAVLLSAAFFGCSGSDSITSPNDTSTTTSGFDIDAHAPAPNTGTPGTGTVPAGFPPAGSVKIWKTGQVDATGPLDKQICYFRFGPHEQKLLDEASISLKAGEFKTYPISVPTKDRCLQIDVADDCSRSSIMPGLIADERVGTKCDTDCVVEKDGDEKLIDDTGWKPISCSELETRCDKTCKCGVRVLTYEQKYTCNKPSVTREEKRYRKSCPTPPPPPPAFCHVSNTGNPNSDEVNLQVTFKRDGLGHLNHCADFKPSLFAASTQQTISCDSHDRRCSCVTAQARWLRCDSQ